MNIKELSKKIKQLENYLGPVMHYNDNGAFKFIKKRNKKDLWILSNLKEKILSKIKKI